MGSRKNNRKTVVRKQKHFTEEQNIEEIKNKKKKFDNQKVPLLQQKEVSEVIDHILQGLKRSSRGLNIGEIKREHKVKIYLLFEELKEDPKNQKNFARTKKSDLEIADVLVDYIKAKNKPIDEILSKMSRKEIDLINKLIFKKLFF
jgi:hypothetical protein